MKAGRSPAGEAGGLGTGNGGRGADGEAGGLSAARLLRWFAQHRRPLPWRMSRDPYRVWVSEVMLQQTRVDTAIPYYQRFLERFPTVEALAAAPEEDVLKAWEGLGYYSRARKLQQAAREVVERYGGRFPDDAEALAALPGIGPYTAGAVAAIAFNRPVAAVDGNVLRVMARVLGIAEDVARPVVRRRIAAAVEAMIPEGQASAFAEALMELGALVCTPRRPACTACPWQDGCAARQDGQEEILPVRSARTRPRTVYGAVALIHRGDEVLVARRPGDGLLAGTWEFPWTQAPSAAQAGPELARELAAALGWEVHPAAELAPVRHVFSHLEWRLRVFACPVEDASAPCRTPAAEAAPRGATGETAPDGPWPEVCWATAEDLARLTLGRAHRRIGEQWLRYRRESGLSPA